MEIEKIKKRWLSIVIIAAALVVAASLLVLAFLEIPSVKKCRDLNCVRRFAKEKYFRPGACKKLEERLRDECYYTFEVENDLARKISPGKYCDKIKSGNLRSYCLYETGKEKAAFLNSKEMTKITLKAMASLNSLECDKISIERYNKKCLEAVALIKKAKQKRNEFTCFRGPTGISYEVKKKCFEMMTAK